MKLVPVILCGGSGTRLWPVSRRLHPKQFHDLGGSGSLLQRTALRLRPLSADGAPLIVCSDDHRFLVAEHLRESAVEPAAILLEPRGRNTAPAAALAAWHLARMHGDALMLVAPSDHLVPDDAAFQSLVRDAAGYAEDGRFVLFGVVPESPETGFGYIRRGRPLVNGALTAYEVDRFVEKPDPETAKRCVAGRDHYWNSGIFLFRAQRLLEELARFQPDVHRRSREAYDGAAADGGFLRAAAEAFNASPAISIDHAVMEKVSGAVVVPFSGAWSDIGSWSGLARTGASDDRGNVCDGDVILKDARNCYVRSGGRLVAVLGMDDAVVVETDDAVLVTHKNLDQHVKELVSELERSGRGEAQVHRRVHRPWGSYQGLDQGPGFQVKRLIVKPGHSISLQRHRHRSEHWVVVRGRATVTRDGERLELLPNQSTYVAAGVVHKLENQGADDLEVIEVQTGDYLGEDDIQRFEDRYGRAILGDGTGS
jgi:mannose-1-phosphate guanylyltransferase/mannose-6-phosphate isomerase